jgi:succinate dehydrogenase / fumarate reductase, cytochrome b subunit
MSTLGSTTTALPVRRPRSRAAAFFGSTIGQKAVMAATGVMLSGFVLGHMVGNLNVFLGAEAIDGYSRMLHALPELLWLVRLVLLGAIGLHIWAFLALTRRSSGARAQGYRQSAYQESTYASRSMRYTGPFLAAFIVFHLLHMTTGTLHPQFEDGAVYQNLMTGLRVIPVAMFYVAATATLAFHLFHGVWSMFQTLGIGSPRYASLGRQLATAFTVVVAGGFTLVPLAIVFGILR